MKPKVFRWYKIVGYAVDATEKSTPFTYMIESESPHNVLKFHGGRRQCETPEGKWVTVQFPTRERDVQLMPHWTPADIYASGAVAGALSGTASAPEVMKVVPVTKYVCTCGREHYSEHPYRSMWCQCGQKAYPVSNPWDSEASPPPSEAPHPDAGSHPDV